MHYPDLGSASDWLKENSLAAQPIRSPTKIRVVHVISMELLRSLLRRRFARAQAATSQNVGCFLRLTHTESRCQELENLEPVFGMSSHHPEVYVFISLFVYEFAMTSVVTRRAETCKSHKNL